MHAVSLEDEGGDAGAVADVAVQVLFDLVFQAVRPGGFIDGASFGAVFLDPRSGVIDLGGGGFQIIALLLELLRGPEGGKTIEGAESEIRQVRVAIHDIGKEEGAGLGVGVHGAFLIRAIGGDHVIGVLGLVAL